jgi:hypothetical protein
MSAQDLGPRAMSHEPDPYLQWDASYVLGALSSSERREFEQHLAGCPGCQRAVSEIAGMPGLLAQASPEDAAALTGSVEELDEGLPPEFGPTLLSRARHSRRQRVLLTVGSIAAALVLIVGGVGLLFSRGIIGTPSTYRVPFSAVAPSGITAVVDVTPGRSETTLKVECQYAGTAPSTPGGPYEEYAIWVRDRSGNESEVKSWYAKPNKVMRPGGTAPIATWRLDEIEIREAHTGEVLLTAPVR